MSSFSTGDFQRKAAEQKPWRSRPSTGGSGASGSRRAARAQVQALTGERTEMLQAYLSAQLSNLTDDGQRESLTLGMSVGMPGGGSDFGGEQPRRSRRGSRATSLSSLDGTELLDDATLEAALYDDRARPLEQSDRITPGDQRTYSRPSSRESSVSTHLSQKPLVERWPAQMTKPKVTDIEPDAPRFASRRPPLHPVDDNAGDDPSRPKLPRPVPNLASGVGSSSGATDQLSKSAPKLLSDLEFFVSTELQAAGIAGSDNTGHPERLRIFSECFDCFIEHCTTYQPLLSKVKAEYDSIIAQLEEKNDSIRPGMTKLAVLEAETSDEMTLHHNAFLRETHGLREALKQAQWEREELMGKVQRQSAELKILRAQTTVDKVTNKDKDELNDALSAGINHLKMINVDSEAIFKDRERLQLELDEANHKINMLKIKNEGGVCKSEWDGWCKRYHTLEKDLRMQVRFFMPRKTNFRLK